MGKRRRAVYGLVCRAYTAPLLTSMLWACGTEPEAFEDLAGSFEGDFDAIQGATGDVYVGDFTLELTQDGGALSGSWVISGVINGTTPSAGMGPFTATLQEGPDPSFSAQLSYGGCPGENMNFTGAYESSSGALTLAGVLRVPDAMCTIAAAYVLNAEMSR